MVQLLDPVLIGLILVLIAIALLIPLILAYKMFKGEVKFHRFFEFWPGFVVVGKEDEISRLRAYKAYLESELDRVKLKLKELEKK
jgi:hypothetical protein